ncbi:MAG: aspartate aminotransferase family protein [Candidatus Bathyarchaeia archaeon]
MTRLGSMDKAQIIGIEQSRSARVYERFPVVAVKARGASLWDIDGKEYVDCMSAYGVGVVGHCHPRVVEAIKSQAERIIACHSSLYNDARAEFIAKLTEMAPRGLNQAFLCNSGAEAVEGAIKLARKHTGKSGIIAMMGSFHGKTMGALSVTWNPKYRDPFQPLLGNVQFVPYGNAERLRAALTPETGAVITEAIQGESGVKLPPEGYLQQVRELCDEKDALLIVDEVQTGLGRTGRLWASEHSNVTPDIMCLAKGLGGGVPLGAVLAREEVMASFERGDHSSTFGGNPLAAAAGSAVLDVLREEGLPERAAKLGGYFEERLERLQRTYRVIRETRGRGLMLALDLRFDVRDALLQALDAGVILLYSGKATIRLLPPLVIEQKQIDFAVEALEKAVISEEEKMAGKPS